MPQLTELQKSIIMTRLRDGVSIRAISAEINVTNKTVLRAKRKFDETGSIRRKQGTGRRKISIDDDDVQLVNFLREHPFATAVQARIATNFPGSTRTARKRIRESELRNRAAANNFFLTEANKLERLRFAQQFVNNENNFWENIVFSDEKTFQSCSNGRVRVYRPVGERYTEQYIHKIQRSGRFSVNTWGWISAQGLGICVIVEERLIALIYRDILEHFMLPSVIPVLGNNFVFQHDNCRIHTAGVVRNFLETNGVATLPWPARSPDLNPIENIWGIMAKQINDRILPNNREELIQSISDTWHAIPVEYVRNTVLSMPRRLQSVIDSAGAAIKY